jgi:hypothetical protein
VFRHLLQRHNGKRLDTDRLAFRTPPLILKRAVEMIRRDLPGAVGLALHSAGRSPNGFQSPDMRFDKTFAGGRLMQVVKVLAVTPAMLGGDFGNGPIGFANPDRRRADADDRPFAGMSICSSPRVSSGVATWSAMNTSCASIE